MSCDQAPCGAYCNSCNASHHLARHPAFAAARELMAFLDKKKRIDLDKENKTAQKQFQTDSLYGTARGKMFGVLTCQTQCGEQQVLKAFSGQFNGLWEVDGWAPPLFDVLEFYRLTTPVEKRIKALGRELKNTTDDSSIRSRLLQERKTLSQQLMKEIHGLYRLNNFKGEQCSLGDLFYDGSGIPTGTGDCCAPKLLNFAAIHGLQPLALTEFYWGKTNRSGTRHEGQFYSPCAEKCGPILGFLLCGIEK
ncbi:MAG: hypothetical protein K9K37_02565 [Desulfocapsa sp.]|nr:hypothetical protein [Desulfocapsa sp.]